MAVSPSAESVIGETVLSIPDAPVHYSDAHHGEVRGSTMTFHHVEYTVKVRKRCCGLCRGTTKKKILNDVSGKMKPGLNVIMGPTGSGKTTLLDVLARRKDPTLLKGQVLLDGGPTPQDFNYISGYVKQNDLLLGTVSVRESLWFCANLRLSSKLSHSEKKKRIDGIINELGLQSCSETKIGNDIIRGISGGEKKRTSIALELILEPKILFLDEPTTGLDAATASSVMNLLKNLGEKGNTIVCSLHQPRYSIFKLFDSLTLLSNGNIVFHGDNAKALQHFENCGYSCDSHDNPADFLLDVLNGSHEDINKMDDGEEEIDRGILSEKLKDQYEQGPDYKELCGELEKLDRSSTKMKRKSNHFRMYATSFGRQLAVLLSRSAKNMARNPQSLIGNVVLNVIFGLVFGIIYYQVDNSPLIGIQNRLGIIFFICTIALFGSVSAIDIFKAEREIFINEHASGYYRIISYYLAKVLADLIPLRTLPPLLFCSITYWMVGLNASAGAFFIFVLGAILVGYAAIGIGLFYSTTFSKVVSELLLIITFVFTIIFSGLLVNLDSIMSWISWLQYLSVARYGLVGLSINELRGQFFQVCGASLTSIQSSLFATSSAITVTTMADGTICLSIQGDEYLRSFLGVGSSTGAITDWDLWQNFVALGVIVIGLYVIAYIQLARVKVYS